MKAPWWGKASQFHAGQWSDRVLRTSSGSLGQRAMKPASDRSCALVMTSGASSGTARTCTPRLRTAKRGPTAWYDWPSDDSLQPQVPCVCVWMCAFVCFLPMQVLCRKWACSKKIRPSGLKFELSELLSSKAPGGPPAPPWTFAAKPTIDHVSLACLPKSIWNSSYLKNGRGIVALILNLYNLYSISRFLSRDCAYIQYDACGSRSFHQ